MRFGAVCGLVMMAALASGAAAVRADVPSPDWSTVDPCLVFCPVGDDTFRVVVRKLLGRQYANPIVVIEYFQCPGFHVCPPGGGDHYLVDPGTHTIRVTGDVQGLAVFPVRAGGACPAGAVNIYADGVLLATRAFASPDQNGDGGVDGRDLTLLQSRLGTADPVSDLSCDGQVTAADAALLLAHTGHSCFGATPALAPTWGSLKLIYR